LASISPLGSGVSYWHHSIPFQSVDHYFARAQSRIFYAPDITRPVCTHSKKGRRKKKLNKQIAKSS
jgi:hypothetical protein